MADNVAITAGTGTTVAADEVTDATLGLAKVQYVKLMDGTLDGTTKAAVTANGLTTSLGTKLAGEDLTNDILKVEQRFNATYIGTSVTTLVKTGAGQLHALNIWLAGATGNTITVYDNTAASGTIIATISTPTIGSFMLNASFATGLTIVTAGTTAPNLTVTFR